MPKKPLGTLELMAIALGGMVGGGIFSILGISVSIIGALTPIAVAIGGLIAALAAYSYVKLGVYFKDDGATYAFMKRTFSESPGIASLVGWWVVFGYISTLALYAYTFASYAISGMVFAESDLARKICAALVILVFTLINIWSVRGMGKLEDLMVYSKLLILLVISFVLINNSKTTVVTLVQEHDDLNILGIFIVASVTFVAYEGFQLVINAVGDMEQPERQIPRAIYGAITIAILIYVVMSFGALLAIPFDDIVRNQEYALASGAKGVLGHWGSDLVVLGALLATSSAISGTIFGASRQMAAIARDGYLPGIVAIRHRNIPVAAILTMAGFAILLVFVGGPRVILEFGSVTFLLVSFLVAYANHKIRHKTRSSIILTSLTLFGLVLGIIFILYFEATTQPEQLIFIGLIFAIITIASTTYAAKARIR